MSNSNWNNFSNHTFQCILVSNIRLHINFESQTIIFHCIKQLWDLNKFFLRIAVDIDCKEIGL